jgi:hypothetical protein
LNSYVGVHVEFFRVTATSECSKWGYQSAFDKDRFDSGSSGFLRFHRLRNHCSTYGERLHKTEACSANSVKMFVGW